jgi:hypothetical protein
VSTVGNHEGYEISAPLNYKGQTYQVHCIGEPHHVDISTHLRLMADLFEQTVKVADAGGPDAFRKEQEERHERLASLARREAGR